MMNNYVIGKEYLLSESDVEQKIVWPLLTNEDPIGLGLNKTQVHTKNSLRKLKIDKGENAQLYFPDYVVVIDGLPLMVVEVKKVDENLEEAYREARLYATEINSLFKSGINPTKWVVACNGLRLLAGLWDSHNPTFNIEVESWIPTNANFGAFVEYFKLKKLQSEILEIKHTLRTNVVFKKPTHLLGGKHIQNLQTSNTFGETISIQYRHLFNPTNELERAEVVKNAYVKVDKHLSHVDPIDRLIRKKVLPRISETIEIEDNLKPDVILEKLRNAGDYSNQVLLLVGSVGSGKSTFMSYLKEVALDRDLVKKIVWSRLDLNDAPVNPTEIYKWLKESICEGLKELEEIDVESMEGINSIYSKELSAFNKVALELFDSNSEKYKEKLFDKIQEITSNLDTRLRSYIEFFVHRKHKELVVILDNCDKRNLDEQLLMFEVASWLKENTKSIVFLPLRETTFDHFKHQKPLDTVVKDLIFRINPPLLEKVIYNRVKFAARLSEKSGVSYYLLKNGIKVSYPSTEELYYLRSILKSLFQNKFFKKLITGIAGRDIRKGIEFFLDFCKSGHINEGDILKMKNSKGEHSLANHVVSKVFIRGNREYYSDSDTKIKNLFYSDPSDKLPNPFVRVAILSWLNDRARIKGPSGILGFHKVESLIADLMLLGHSSENLLNEIKNFIKSGLIISESQNLEKLEIDELISINSPGIIHLDLLSTVDYLASCAEDVWYNNAETATRIADRISKKNVTQHFSMKTSVSNSQDLIDYLENYSKEYYSIQKEFLSEDSYSSPINFEKINKNIEQLRNVKFTSHSKAKNQDI